MQLSEAKESSPFLVLFHLNDFNSGLWCDFLKIKILRASMAGSSSWRASLYLFLASRKPHSGLTILYLKPKQEHALKCCYVFAECFLFFFFLAIDSPCRGPSPLHLAFLQSLLLTHQLLSWQAGHLGSIPSSFPVCLYTGSESSLRQRLSLTFCLQRLPEQCVDLIWGISVLLRTADHRLNMK